MTKESQQFCAISQLQVRSQTLSNWSNSSSTLLNFACSAFASHSLSEARVSQEPAYIQQATEFRHNMSAPNPLVKLAIHGVMAIGTVVAVHLVYKVTVRCLTSSYD